MTEPVDIDARQQISHAIDQTLFVEAGAGSGKTAALVGRVESLVLAGVPLERIAAVTFTERAAAELRERLRDRLEKTSTSAESEPAHAAAAQAAVDSLDLAAIGTLHSFAQRILSEHPIEAGIPPTIEVLDEVSSSVEHEARWLRTRTELLDDPEMDAAVALMAPLGITPDHVRSIITKLTRDWDLVADRIAGTPRPSITRPDLASIIARARVLGAHADFCTSADDKLLPDMLAMNEWVDAAAAVDHSDDEAMLDVLQGVAELKWRYGAKGNWPSVPVNDLKADCKAWQEEVSNEVARVTDAVLRSIMHWCGGVVLADAQRRRAAGRLEFHDLLVIARNLLREHAEVRAALQTRYQRLLLDEFQDTDPIQIEIAMRIAGGAAAGSASWKEIVVPAGSLFVVGDPKQSIYRFRRADIEMYLDAQEVLGGQTSLTTNFRTGAPILEWVNAVFAELIQPVAGMHPGYQPLDEHRPGPTVGPAVSLLGGEPHDREVLAAQIRSFEAADVAASIVTALREKWTTSDRRYVNGQWVENWRPLRPGDITILVPARTSLPFLEQALDDAGIRYRTESSSLVYHGAEIRALLAACRALADPSDEFSLLTALRSPLFGCSDADLWHWRHAGGRIRLHSAVPAGLEDHPVAGALDYLRALHREARWLTPSTILTRLVVDRRVLEAAVFSPRVRDAWRRVRFVIDQARAWSESEHGGLRSYVAWAAVQSSETARVSEAVLPESDVDSVRIMTIHAAKGLEFPMVVLSGMSARPMRPTGVMVLWHGDGYAARLSKDITTGDFTDVAPLDEQMSDHERRRLLYVAATRARDHLVVSLHRSSGNRDGGSAAKLLVSTGEAVQAAGAHHLPVTSDQVLPAPSSDTVPPPPDWSAWRARMDVVAERSAGASSESASGLEGTEPDALVQRADDGEPLDGLAKGARDLGSPAWAKGRYGSAIGRAVHAVLQSVPLDSPGDIAPVVAAQCVAEGVTDFAELVSALVESALQSDVVRRAAQRPHWRECYVGLRRDDGTVLEGIVDLIYREDDGSLVVVDYKTDDVPEAALRARAAYYRPQVRAYRDMVATATGQPVADPVLVFATSGGAPITTAVP